MANLLRTLTALCLVGFVAPGMKALAGDGDYDGASDVEGLGPAYFGFVRDTRGAAVPDARVTLHPRSGEAVVVSTNVLGLYRSHVSKEAAPDEVSVSCEKNGFKQANVIRRTPPGSMAALVETNCTLQRL
jgi:hypothetical protein